MELKHCFLAPMLKAKPRDERIRSMDRTQLFKSAPSWIKPVVVISLALLVSFGCKEQSSSSQPPPTGMPPPPSGGMPAPPSGGMPPPPGGGMPSPPSPSSGSPGDGMPQPPSPSSGSEGDGSDSSPTDSSQGGEESGGEIGSFPAEEADGPPPMPGTGGAGEGAEAGAEESTSGGGESEESSDWDEESVQLPQKAIARASPVAALSRVREALVRLPSSRQRAMKSVPNVWARSLMNQSVVLMKS